MALNLKPMRTKDNASSLRQDQAVDACFSWQLFLTACFYTQSPKRLHNPLQGSVHSQLLGLEF